MLNDIFSNPSNPEEVEKDNQQKLEEASLILKTMETEGGQAILKKLDQLMEEMNAPPETFTAIGVDGVRRVDDFFLAHRVGARDAIRSIKQWINLCKRLVEQAAEENSEKGRQEK